MRQPGNVALKYVGNVSVIQVDLNALGKIDNTRKSMGGHKSNC